MTKLKNRFGTYIAQSEELNKKHTYAFDKADMQSGEVVSTVIVYGPEKGWRVNTIHL